MWFLGHTALGFGFAGLVLAVSRTHRFEIRVLVLVPFFANMIDFLHPDEIRLYSHNWVAAIGLPLAALLIWRPWMRWSRTEAAALLAAGLGAPVGDQIFGSFYPFGPVSWLDVEWMEFNSPGDLATEAVLGIALIVILLLLIRARSEVRALRGFRGPWIVSPGVAALVTSALFWGEVGLFALSGLWPVVGILGVPVLVEMVCAAGLVTALGIVALPLTRRDRQANPGG